MIFRLSSLFTVVCLLTSLSFSNVSCTAKKAASTNLVEGTWEFLIQTPRGDRKPIVVIDGTNSTYEGESIEVKIEGPKVTFLAGQEAGSLGRMEFTFEGIADGDNMAGTYTLETGSLKGRSGKFTATRVKKN